MESKTIVVYLSKTGFTKKYAEMIAEEAKTAIADLGSVTGETLSGFRTVVFGGRVHAGTLVGLKKARELFENSSAERFIVFATGGTPNAEKDEIDAFWKKNLSGEELSSLPHFYMQAGLSYEKMGLSDKAMMKFVAAMMKRKADKTETEKGFTNAITGSYDISSREFIAPLVACLKENAD